MKVETVKVVDLSLDPRNARRHSVKNLDAIKNSLARFGQQKPIVVDAGGVVRAGNGTLEAAKLLNWESVKIVRTDLSAPDAQAYAIADNRTGELAEWDEKELQKQLIELSDSEGELFAALEFSDYLESEIKDVTLKSIDLEKKPPIMAWVLIGLPLVQFGQIQKQIDIIAQIENVIIETTQNDGPKD